VNTLIAPFIHAHTVRIHLPSLGLPPTGCLDCRNYLAKREINYGKSVKISLHSLDQRPCLDSAKKKLKRILKLTKDILESTYTVKSFSLSITVFSFFKLTSVTTL